MKLLATLSLTMSAAMISVGAVSGELGAPYPKVASTAEVTLAKAETGASSSWVSIPVETKATAHQLREFEARNESISSDIEKILQASTERKFDNLLAIAN